MLVSGSGTAGLAYAVEGVARNVTGSVGEGG